MTERVEKSRARDASFVWGGIGRKLRYALLCSAALAGVAAWFLGIRSPGGIAGCFLAVHLLVMYFVGLAVVRDDKRRAGTNEWRVPENTILAIAAAGGGLGVLRGMYKYRHKTKHAKFYLGVPCILLLQAAVAIHLLFPGVYSALAAFHGFL